MACGDGCCCHDGQDLEDDSRGRASWCIADEVFCWKGAMIEYVAEFNFCY